MYAGSHGVGVDVTNGLGLPHVQAEPLRDGGPAGLPVRDRDGSLHRVQEQVAHGVRDLHEDRDGARAGDELRRAPAGGLQAGVRHDRSSLPAGGLQADPRDRLRDPDLHGLQAGPDDPAGDHLLHAADDPARDGAHRPQVRPLPQGSLRLQDRGLHHLHPRAGGQGRGLHHDGPRDPHPPGADHPDPV